MIPEISEEEAKIRIARRIACEFNSQEKTLYLNLGVGIPTMVAEFIESENVFIQAENGMLGVGSLARGDEIDDQLINAGRQPVKETVGCSYFDSSFSFGMIRGGHVDATVIGAFEVDEEGNIANWIIPNGRQMGVGGAMDLVTGAKKVIIAMQHTGKSGKPKIVKRCKLPVTGFGEADLIVTELACFGLEKGRLVLKELTPGVTVDDIKNVTEAGFDLSPDLKTMPF